MWRTSLACPLCDHKLDSASSRKRSLQMNTSGSQRQPRYKTWAAWCLVALLLPIGAASCGLLYSVYLQLTSGRLSTVAKGFGRTSSSVSFVESPIWFSVFIVLNAVLAAMFVVLTLVLAKLAYSHLRPRKRT